MTEQRYYADISDVEVTFIDGEVKTYRITANISIGGYLARESGQTGTLVLFNGSQSHGIPIQQIREYVIKRISVNEATSDA